MSILKRNYEISVWQNTYVLAADGNSVESETEAKIAVIGSDKMTSPNRAFEPKLTRKTNGEVKFSFKMYYRYIDNITGEEIENPFCKYLINERKVKLKYKDKWYDFLIRNISEDSANKTFSYELEDAHMIELSKNGFGLTLDNELMNNTDTATKLGEKILQGTGWAISEDSDIIVQTLDEALYECTVTKRFRAHQIIDPILTETGRNIGCNINGNAITIQKDSKIYIFYSSYTEQPYRAQFLYLKEDIIKDDNRIVLNKNCQYFVEDTNLLDYIDTTNAQLSTEYRGRRYVFSQESKYFPKLERYAQSFKRDNKDYYGFVETETVTPQIIQNYVSNHTFKSTAGWRGAVIDDDEVTQQKDYKKEDYVGRCEAGGVRKNKEGKWISLITDFNNGTYSDSYTYKNALHLQLPYSQSAIINNGFQDYKDKFPQGLKEGDEYVVYIESSVAPTDFIISLYWLDGYKTEQGGYYEANDDFRVLLDIFDKPEEWKKRNEGYYRIIKIPNIHYSASQMKSNKIGFVFQMYSTNAADCYLFDFQFFPYVPKENSTIPIFPEEQEVEAKIIDHYYYFTEDEYNKTEVESIKDLIPKGSYVRKIGEKQKEYYTGYLPKYNNTAEKVRSVSVKESNYFNAIQTLAETFECWPEINVEHNSNGTIVSKSIRFRKYVGSDNYAGFRYGTNLKGIKRTLDSKAIVTKLIVKDNTNEFAKNGFCSVARAPSNDLKDTCLYDFSYYINQKLLDAKVHQVALYGEGGYFNNLHDINKEIDTKIEALLPLQESLVQVKANVQLYENTVESAKNNYEDTSNAFINETGFSHLILGDVELSEENKTSLKEQIANSKTIQKYLQELSEFKSTEKTYTEKLEKEKKILESLETRIADLEKGIKDDTKTKEGLDKDFFKRYSHFIQEGTWLDEKYVDDELYYIDAQSVLYNSCFPQVSYSIDIIDLSKLPGYEMFNLGLGDRTYVEDPEFFGYNDDGSCYREEIVITEYQEDLDEPSKDSIKAQNHKTQFQDLFQRITATVQSVQYAEGSYEKAAALADADAAHKVKFLQDALNDAALILNNAGDQSVLVDINGITVTDVDEPSQQIRLVGGGIFLRQQLENGEQRWTTAITAKGINASLITTGQINTGVIQIMNGTEPTFRWDALGITAYDFKTGIGNPAFTYDINTKKGVRFDRLGIYGFDGQDGLSWHPTLEQVQQYATFALTWEGLKVTGTDKTVATIGRHSIDNSSYIMRVVNGEGKETFTITNNGTVTAEIANFKLANIGGWIIEDAFLRSDDYKIYLAPNGVDDDTISGNKETWVIKAGENFGVTPEGRVVAKKGDIAGWNISKGELTCPTTEFYTIGLFSGQEYFFTSLQNNSATSPVRFGLLSHWLTTSKTRFDLYSDTTEYTISINTNSSCEDDFKITQSNLSFDTLPSGWVLGSITNEVQPNEIILYLKFQSSGKSGQAVINGIMYPTKSKALATTSGFPNFAVLADGSLYAKRAKIEGTIYANDGVFNGTVYANDGVFNGVVYANKGVFNGEIFATALNLTRLTNNVGALEIGAQSQTATEWKTGKYKINCKLARSGDKGYVTITPTSNSITERFNGKFTLTAKYSDGSEYGTTIIDGSTGSIIAGLVGVECIITNEDGLKVIEAITEQAAVFRCTIKDENANTNPLSFYNDEIYDLKYYIRGADSGIIMGGTILPYLDYNSNTQDGCDLGSVDKSWRTLYCKDSTWPSDLRLKKNIKQFDETFNEMYDNLHPCRYNFIADTKEKKVHCGYIAQDIESNLNTLFPNQNFALLHKRQKENGDYYYGLEYIEFIALNTWQIQLLKPRMTAAEEEIILLKAEISELRQAIENLQNGEKSDII